MSGAFRYFDQVIGIGSLFAAMAAASPCCLPLLAAAGAVLGLGFLSPYQTLFEWAFQAFALFALIGVIIAYRSHRRLFPVVALFLSVAAILIYYHVLRHAALIYAGLALGCIALYLNHRVTRRCRSCIGAPGSSRVRLESLITCPYCGASKNELMPTDRCEFYYECSGCHQLLRPKPGHCCVFCSYGSVACPSMQQPGFGCRA